LDISIIIVNWNTRQITADCLHSIYAETSGLEYEVIVIDNGSSDNSAEMIREQFRQAILIKNAENRGFAYANNQGIEIAKSRYVLLLNSDTVVLDNAIAKAVAFADENIDAGVIGCRVLNPDMTLQRTCFMYPSILNMLIEALYLNKLFAKNSFYGRERMTCWGRDDVREIDAVTGCFMMVRREVIEAVGMLDTQFFMYAEETDWCYRISEAGWKVMFTNEPEIIHLGGQSSKQMKPEMAAQLRASILLLFKKHKSRFEYAVACVLVSLFFGIRVPYWFLKAALRSSLRRESLITMVTYAKSSFKALSGWRGLCYRE
jgi:GT2 family glycosyltransferase